MKKTVKKFLALILCGVMVLGMLPALGLPVRAAQRTEKKIPDKVYLEDAIGMPGLTFPDEDLKPELISEKDGRTNVLKFLENRDCLEVVSASAEKTITFDFMYEGAFTQYFGIYYTAYQYETGTSISGSILPAWTGSNLMIDIYNAGSLSQQHVTPATVSANTWYTCQIKIEDRTMSVIIAQADGTGTPVTLTRVLPENFPQLDDSKANNFFLKTELNTYDTAVLYVDNMNLETPKEYLEDAAGMPGLSFPDENLKPELISEKDGRTDVLKFLENRDCMEVISDSAEKTITFDFMYEGAFTQYFGIYYTAYRYDAGTSVSGSILPDYTGCNLMIDLYNAGSLAHQAFTAATVSANTWYTCQIKIEDRSMSVIIAQADGTGTPVTLTQTLPDNFPELDDSKQTNFSMQPILNTYDTAVLYVDKLNLVTPEEPGKEYLEDAAGMPGLAFPDENLKPELISEKDGHTNVLKFLENRDCLEVVSASAEKTITFDFMYEGVFTQYFGIYYTAYQYDAGTSVTGSILPDYAGCNLMIDIYNAGSLSQRAFTAATVSANTWYTCEIQLANRTMTITIAPADGTGTPVTLTQALPDNFPQLDDSKANNFSIKTELNTYDTAVLYVDNLNLVTTEKVEIDVAYDSEILEVTGAGSYNVGEEVTLTATVKDNHLGSYVFNGWLKDGALVSNDATYTFTAECDAEYVATFKTQGDEPGYTYFSDNYESYVIGPANKNSMPANYIDFAEVGNYQIAVDPTNAGNQVLSGITSSVNSINFMNMDCEIIDKEISFDFWYDQHFYSYGGLYVNLHCQLAKDGTTDGYYFSLNPNYDNCNIIISCNAGNLGFYSYDFNPGTWYSVKSRLVDNQIFVKVWPQGTQEPEGWNGSHRLEGFTPVAEGSWFGYQFFNPSSSENVNILIDNMNMKTWRQLDQKPQYTVMLESADALMGTVSGGGSYLEGNFAKITAKSASGYRFVNWTDENGNIISDKAVYSFNVMKNTKLKANFELIPVVIRSFMAEGLTEVAQIDETNRTVSLRFASDVDLTNVYPYYYLDAGIEVQQDCYTRMDLSKTVVLGSGDQQWTITATQNGVMKEFFVNPRLGNDGNSGTSASEAFATLEAARNAVRGIDSWTGDVIIHLAKGEYILTETFELGLADSADKGYAVIWQGTNDANEVVINSAQHLNGNWTVSTDVPGLASGLVAWEYDATGLTYSRDLYVDGKMADLAGFVTDETAIGSWGYTDLSYMKQTNTGYEVSGILADIHTWRNPSDIEFVYEVGWTYSILPVTSIVANGSGSTVTMKNDAYQAACTKGGMQIQDPSSIINCFEGLDSKGEWYFDRAAQKIYYITDGADPNGMDVVIPTLDQLITVRGEGGSNAQWVYGVTFKNITFQYTSYLRPHTYGQAEIQASYIVDLDSLNWERYHQHDHFKKTDGGVIASYTEGMRVSGCIFTNMSAGAMDFEIGCRGSQFVGNNITNVGAGGVSVGGVSVRDAQPYSDYGYVNGVLTQGLGADPDRVTQYTLIMSNYLNGIGLSYKGSVGITAGHVADVTIAHNTIINASYTAISCGWGWGAWDGAGESRPDSPYETGFPETASVQARYVIENNNISGVCQRLADGGAVYTLSLMPGSKLNGNVMHDNPTIFGGIYFDEGTGGFTEITGNITYDVHTDYYYHLVGGFTDRKAETDSLVYGKSNYIAVKPTDERADANYEAIVANSGCLSSESGITPPTINPVDFPAPIEIMQQVSLQDDVAMNFVVKADESTTINVYFDGKMVTYDLSAITPDVNGLYNLSVNLAAAQMTEEIKLQFISDGVVTLEKTYSIRKYAERILEGNYSNSTKNMVMWMLNYGAKAQLYFGINTGDLANEGYVLAETKLPAEYTDSQTSGSISGLTYYGASLVFENKLALRFYFIGSIDGVDFGDYEVVKKGSMYYVEIPNINPQDYCDSISMSIAKGEESLRVTYSPLNYIMRMSSKDTTEPELKALLNALYGYHEAALQFINQ